MSLINHAASKPASPPQEPTADASTSALDDPRVRQAVREYLRLSEQGNRPERGAFLAQHAEIAGILAECLDGLDLVQEVAADLDDQEDRDPVGIEPNVPLGDFRIIREIGRGGMGVVFEAVQLSLGRRVALKVLPFAAALDTRCLQRFKNEAQAASLLHHANIVPVHGLGCDRGVYYYAMQFIEGHTLAEVIADLRAAAPAVPRTAVDGSSGAPPAATAAGDAAADTCGSGAAAALATQRSMRTPEFFRAVARLGVQAAEALEHAHQLGVIHRDIKPANLMIDGAGHLWIADFGLARCRTDRSLTVSGDVVGTLRYMSPEQALAKHGLVDHRTDLYALGATLYELLTLQPAYAGNDREELLQLLSAHEPQVPRRINPKVPVELDTIVLKAMAHEPERRYRTAAELADDLRRFLDHRPILAKRTSIRERIGKWAWRHRALVGAAGAGLALAAATLLVSTILLWRANEHTHDALLDAEAKGERAERNFGKALQGVNRLLWELEVPRWADYGRIMPLREEMTKRGLEFFREFVHEDSTDPAVLFESARAYRYLANVHCGQQQVPEAFAAMARAIDIFGKLTVGYPTVTVYRLELARTHRQRGILYYSLGQSTPADADLSKMVELFQRALTENEDKDLLNEFAWFRADCPCDKFRNPAQAIAYARQALALAPNDARYWNTLGVAYFRAGDWPAAADALRKSMNFQAGGNPYDWFFLAMICWQQGDRPAAQAWYDKSVAWLRNNTLMTEELFRYQAEAAAMLGSR